jgi:hypothetical protein
MNDMHMQNASILGLVRPIWTPAHFTYSFDISWDICGISNHKYEVSLPSMY